MIRFTRQSVRPDGEPLYRLEKDGEVLREGITLDEVICAINRMDEERAGLKKTDCRTGAAALVRNDRTGEVRRGRGV